MQCLQLTRGEPPKTTVDVVLSGDFHNGFGYVTIDGTKYTSEQTLKVAKGTSVTVYCGSSNSFIVRTKITLNGTTVAQGTSDAGAEYTFDVTYNCSIVISRKSVSGYIYYIADITMPA